MLRKNCIKETLHFDFSNSKINDFVADAPIFLDKKDLAVFLFYKVRDCSLYDPYHLNIRSEAMIASVIVNKKRMWCVEKAILLVTCLRKFKIPARLGFAIVTNHIGVDKLVSYLRKEEIVFHGFVEVFLNGKWIKCTPSFDKRICNFTGVSTLEWDGENDSMFQAFDNGIKFMEYKHYYGSFEDVPVELMNLEMKKHYPHLFESKFDSKEFSFFHSL